jgi:hypothetical protein
MPTFKEDLHLGHEVALVNTDDIRNKAVTTEKLDDEAVTTEKIADGAVTNEKIADNTIVGSKFADNSIDNDKVVDGTLSGAKFLDDSISGTKIQDNTIPGSKLADGSIESVDIKDNTLEGSKLVDNTIDGSKIKDNQIESRHLLDNSIPAEKSKNNTIESIDLKDGTLSGTKIKDNTIESAKLADNAVTTDKLAAGAVTTAKLNDGAVNTGKLDSEAVTTTKIADGAVTTAKMDDEAVTTAKLADGSVTTAKLADGLITELQTVTDATPTENSVKPIQSGGVYDALQEVNTKINALSSGVKVSLTISPSTIYKDVSQSITLTGTMTNGTPTSMKLFDGSTELKATATSPITHTMSVTQSTNSKSYSVQGVTLGMTLNAQASVNARYPIYYGFGANASAVAVAANKYAATTSALHTYSKTASANGQHFYILVPSDISNPSEFSMGGAPFVMTSSSQTIDGVSYTVYESGGTYNSGKQLSVTAQ